MTTTDGHPGIKLDPWSASSLLQKAIRRGETNLASLALKTLYQQRGNAIWKRLITIAFEDVGIAAPKLVSEVTWLCTDAQLRATIGDDLSIALDLVRQLAQAPKDRSSDYLYSAALNLPEASRERSTLSRLSINRCIDIASDARQPLLRRSIATLLHCTVDGLGAELRATEPAKQLLVELDRCSPSTIHHASLLAASRKCHPIALMVPILFTEFIKEGAPPRYASPPIPAVEYIGLIPTYTYDKHTWIGKNALSRFSRENNELSEILDESSFPGSSKVVAQLAAFYVDAIPVQKRLVWSQSALLESLGREADLISAGCIRSKVEKTISCVQRNISHLNSIRREIALRGNKQ